MADKGEIQPPTAWPMPKFHFVVSFDDTEMQFAEVSGLDAQTQPVGYRAGNMPVVSVAKIPGVKSGANITMKRGVLVKGAPVSDWFAQIKMNSIARKALTIALMDEKGKPTMIWQVHNAFPVKMTGPDLTADGNEIAVESIEFAHDGLTITNG